MNPDENVCLCNKVSLRKIRTFLKREKPPVASRLSDCLGAGTGCGWCCPFLEQLHTQSQAGEEPDLPLSPADYAKRRSHYRQTGQREE